MLKSNFSMPLVIGFAVSFPLAVDAATYELPLFGNTIGSQQEHIYDGKESLAHIAERYDLGLAELRQANPKLNKKGYLKKGVLIQIPGQYQLPSVRQAIVVDLSQLRAFYFSKDGKTVSTYPIGIGRGGWETPAGTTQIISKQKDPAWHPTEHILEEAEDRGKELPTVVPAGPHNPLGAYAIHLGFSGILMHGTNAPSTVGLRGSHGCMRMYANDIKELFYNVTIGMPVHILK